MATVPYTNMPQAGFEPETLRTPYSTWQLLHCVLDCSPTTAGLMYHLSGLYYLPSFSNSFKTILEHILGRSIGPFLEYRDM